MSRQIEHEILAPDGRSLTVIAVGGVRRGETIQRFIDRQGWYFHLPTRCFLNGEVIPPAKLKTHRIRIKDEIRIVSRPGHGGASGGGSTAKSVGMIVAMVSLAIIAPWAGAALAGAILPAGLATVGASVFGAVAIGGNSYLLEDLNERDQHLRPR